MKRLIKSGLCPILFLLLIVSFQVVSAQTLGKNPDTDQILLPNGWKLSPVNYHSLPLGDLPLNMVVSKNHQYLAVTNNGQSTQTIQLFNPKKERQLDSVVVSEAWYGLAFSPDAKHLYASGGNENVILDFKIANNKLGIPDTLRLGAPWPTQKISPAGIAVDSKNQYLYVVTKEDSSVYEVNLKTKTAVRKAVLPAMAYDCALTPDDKTLFISVWGQNKVAVYDVASGVVMRYIIVGSHPNQLILNKKGTVLYVANANDNTVSVISTSKCNVLETLSASLYPTKLTGSTTNALALCKNEKTLYVANADNNCLAVFNVSNPGHSFSEGFIPVGWYPTCVQTLGGKILVADAKGFTSMANPFGPQPIRVTDENGHHKGGKSHDRQYIGSLFKGRLSFIQTPDDNMLKNYTKQVYEDASYKGQDTKLEKSLENNPIPSKKGDVSPIKYVFYIIKENRTYDQVLGDMPEGNGDSSLCIFGDTVTPNLHKIARNFVLLDNFYVDAEVSADGHNWSTAAYATDMVEKTWPTYYGSRGGNYVYEGENPASYPRDGYIWNYCQRAGVSYRTYGEFANFGETHLKALEGHVCLHSPGFNLKIKDQVRYEAWAHDFDSLLAIHAVPHFSTIRFSNDHTSGQELGAYTPLAAVADNDLAVGRLLEHLSHSSIWKQSVVFVLEDDAQDGPDHVDAHRSPVFVAGPYVRRDTVIHQMYSTSSVLRTIELILGLPPMSQYDAAAMPLFQCFMPKPDMTPYTSVPNNINLDLRNTKKNKSSKLSATFNLNEEDRVPDDELNLVVWKAVKGEDSEMPAPRHCAFVIPQKSTKDDD